MRRAFYSLVQYCPDRFRSEAINIGLVLVQPDPHEVRARFTIGRVQKFGTYLLKPSSSKKDNFALHDRLNNLTVALQGMRSQIEQADIRTENDLANFAAKLANDIRLTEPRLAKIDDIDLDFDRMFYSLGLCSVEHKSICASWFESLGSSHSE